MIVPAKSFTCSARWIGCGVKSTNWKGLRINMPQTLAEQREIDVDIEHLEIERHETAAQLLRMKTAHKLIGVWQRRAELDSQLHAAGPPPNLPENALEQLDTLERAANNCRRRLANYRPRRRRLAARARQIKFNEALWRKASKIAAFCDQQEWISTLEHQLDAVSTKWPNCRGSSTPRDGVPAGLRQKRRTRSTRKPLPNCDRPLGSTETVVKHSNRRKRKKRQIKQTIAAIAQQIAGGLAEQRVESFGAALEQAGTAVSQLRRRLHLDGRAEQSAGNLKDLQSQRLELLERQIVPGWLVTGMAGVFAVGVAIFLAGLLLPLGGSQTLGLGVAGLGLAGVIGVVISKFLIERRNQQQLERCEKQLEMLSTQAQQTQEEREGLDKQLPKGGGPLTMRLQAAEKELAQLEELIPLDTRRRTLERELAATARTIEQAKQEQAARRAGWQKVVAALGLPDDFAPAQLRGFRHSNQRLELLKTCLAACAGARSSAPGAVLDRRTAEASPGAGRAQCARLSASAKSWPCFGRNWIKLERSPRRAKPTSGDSFCCAAAKRRS